MNLTVTNNTLRRLGRICDFLYGSQPYFRNRNVAADFENALDLISFGCGAAMRAIMHERATRTRMSSKLLRVESDDKKGGTMIIKNCPFCGAEADGEDVVLLCNDDGLCVQCQKCGLTGACSSGEDQCDEEAIENWNCLECAKFVETESEE